MKSKWYLLLGFIITFLFLSGCWNAKELTEMSLVSAVGIDKTKEEYRVSFQIINAGEVATGQEGGQRNAATTIVYSSTGNTIFEAIRKTTQKVPRKLYFPHTNLIVISEQFAKEEGIEKVIDWFERDHEFRTNIQVIIARETKAEEILKIQSPVERISAKKITTELETTEKVWGENLVMEIDDIIQALISKGKEVAMSGVRIRGDKNFGAKVESLQQSYPAATLEVSGTAIFKDGKLIRWVENKEARGTSWILDNIQSTIVNLDCDGQKDAIAIEVIRSNTKINSLIKNGKPTIQVIINEEGNIGEANCSYDFEQHKNITELEKQLEEEIKSEAMRAIAIAQQEKSDFLGFGNVIQRQHPKRWKEYESEWPDLFSTLEVDVQVHAFIRRTGMRFNSFSE
ncbi:Ger(x)C family spore germination protein [Alkalihalobacillus sp. BA299]|uniref:Ger(x)C family spore germination protein n=1 Tax=Alkalihalobacillus sp. BA299 TaxID=2815938 RepID=UPI001ADC12D6|nr:Ger(x)C family spore germination protein [Alkalihalobacillus sp. BA299]